MSAGGVERTHARSLASKLVFAGLHVLSVAAAGGVAFGAHVPDGPRARLLFAVAVLYLARHLLTLFVLLKRRVAMSEVLGLAAFMASFEIGGVAVGGGLLGAGAPLGVLDGLAVGLVLVGSVLNSGSELQRWAWKRHPENRGHCYTGGLFAWSMHVNYFGDTVLFTGWALLVGRWWALGLPAFMAAGFVFFHIPALDAYLDERYGDEHRAWAARTARFVPLLY